MAPKSNDDRSARASDNGTPDLTAPAAVALREATERLCSRRNAASVSIRDVAEEAGLSPGLVYHYYDSREHLFGATLAAIAHEMVQGMEPTDSPVTMSHTILDAMFERPAFPRMITALHLDGHDVSELMGSHPFIEFLVRSGGSDTEARVSAATAVGFLLAAGIFHDGLLRVVNVPGETEALKAAQAGVLASLFTSPGSSAPDA